MKLARQEDISLLFMSELAKQYGNGVLSLSYVARDHGVSVLFLKKLARNLRLAGLIVSKEGASGGYALSRRPADISVWDVVRAIDSGFSLPRELRGRSVCPIYARCLPQTIRRIISGTLEDSLSRVSLQKLIS